MSRTSSQSRPKVALVTGASRGVGKGIALALGRTGMTVYVTGRSVGRSLGTLKGVELGGTIGETARSIDAAGGRGIAIACDHRDDRAVAGLFERIRSESKQLDILVNNAAVVHDNLIDPGGFWQKPLELVDILDVGLRSAYVASYHAASLMAEARRGLITFISSFGSSCYMHGPAYGAQKAGLDKFAADMAVDLKEYAVATVSLWLGPQLTERTSVALKTRPDQYEHFMSQAETPEFNGRIIHALACDAQVMNLSGRTLITAELAERYGVVEADGRHPPSYRDMLGSPRVPHPALVM